MKQELEVKTRRSILRGRNGGQAVVEYILIVSVAVGLIFMLKGVFKGVNEFIGNYLGEYVTCLMAHGELPALGVTNDDLKEHLNSGYICNSKFKSFTLAEGRPPIAGGNDSGNASRNSSGKGGSNSGSSSTNSSSGSNKGSSGKSDKDGDSDQARRGGGSGGSNPYDDGKIRRGGRSTTDGFTNAQSNTRLIDDEGDGDEAGGRGRKRKPRESRIIYRDRQRYRAVLGNEAEQIVNQTQRSTIKRKPTSRSIAKVEGGTLNGPRSGLMRPPPEKKPVVEDTTDSGWGFGKFLKWLLIIGIIVALVIFFGGQLLNYSNSDS